MWLVAPRYVVLDIETVAGCPDDAEAAFLRVFCPNPNWKAATIGERYLDALQQRRERLALLDSSPLITVALATDTDCRILHWLPVESSALYGVPLERYSSERMMLARLRDYLESCSDTTLFVGHNIVGFDLPRLRLRYLTNGLRIPRPLTNTHQPVYDTMLVWTDLFSIEGAKFISLHDCLEIARLPSHKTIVSGADVQRLYDAGEYLTLLLYAILDVLAERALFLCMTGQSDDRTVPDAPVRERTNTTETHSDGNIETAGTPSQSQDVPDSVKDILASMGIRM